MEAPVIPFQASDLSALAHCARVPDSESVVWFSVLYPGNKCANGSHRITGSNICPITSCVNLKGGTTGGSLSSSSN